jgi:hypothetical protein
MQLGRMLMVAGTLAVLGAAAARAEDRALVRTPELVVVRSAASETCAFPAANYSDFKLDGTQASFTLEGQALPAGSRKLGGGGISEVDWTPGDGSTAVTIKFATAPQSTLLNAVPGTADRPRTAQVLAGFLFAPGTLADGPHPAPALGARDVAGGGAASPAQDDKANQPGAYALPKFRPVHYSDALVTLNVHNADFRDILFLMSRIGNVSIMIDPYYDDEPTGSKRSGKGGGTGGQGQGSGEQGGTGLPDQNGPGQAPVNGTGYVTLNFKDVPFDQALDLLLQSAGLVKADVYPNSPLAQ